MNQTTVLAHGLPALLVLVMTVVACTPRKSGTDDAALQERMQDMQEELGALQADLRARLVAMQGGKGRGAYADGPRSITGTETVLERLHRTKLTLSQAQNALDQKTRTIISMRREREDQQEQIVNLSSKAERLARAEDRRITALQERQAALRIQEQLRQSLVECHLARLESEKRFFELITEVIRLDPSQTQEFFQLQARLREEARLHKPADLAMEADEQP